jgi:flagellar motility protein MotE (MotC chaperone)
MAEVEAGRSYSGMERFMFFLTPILFTLVLLGVLLTLFNVDLRNRFLEAGNKVPFLESILPEAPAAEGEAVTDAAIRETNVSEKIAELEALLASKEIEVTQLASANTQQEQTIADLQAQLEQLNQIGQEKQLDDEAYQARITELASMFGQITPSKAAPILQSMTLEEMVLIMDAMRPEIRVAVMEKMAPARAAEATVMLKDTVSAKDRQIAALQARLNEQAPTTGQTNPYLDDAQLSGTFNNMAPESAAALLLQMAEVSPAKTLQILNTVDDASRSEIIAEMSELNEKYTAQLVAKLMVGR